MTPEIEERILRHLDHVEAANKRFDSLAKWRVIEGRTKLLLMRVAVRLDGVLGGGASVLIATPAHAWESDVYGHIEVKFQQFQRSLRVHPLEWRPIRPHTNPPDCPEPHASHRLKDRWHPYDLNRDRGVACLSQGKPGVAVELPRAISNFEEYLEMAANVWRCPDLYDVPRPEWTKTLI